MLYFFHHYELPVILQQAQLQHILRNHHHQTAGVRQAAAGLVGAAPAGTSGLGVGTGAGSGGASGSGTAGAGTGIGIRVTNAGDLGAGAVGTAATAVHITTRLSQFLSAVRPTAAVQTSTVSAHTTSTMSQTAVGDRDPGRPATTQTSHANTLTTDVQTSFHINTQVSF